MGFHHVAVACRDTEAMGFELVKAVVAPTEHPGGWAKHLFYDTGGDGLIAFWELYDERVDQFDPAISTGLGLPIWVNHLAFGATLDTIGPLATAGSVPATTWSRATTSSVCRSAPTTPASSWVASRCAR